MRELDGDHGLHANAPPPTPAVRPRDNGDAAVDAPAKQPATQATVKPGLEIVRDSADRVAKYFEYQRKAIAVEQEGGAGQVEPPWAKVQPLESTRDNQQRIPEGTTNVSAVPDETATHQESVDTDRGVTRPEKSGTSVESLRARVAELEADKEHRDRRIAVQAEKITVQEKIIAELYLTRAEQDKRVAHLEDEIGQIKLAVGELKQQGEAQASKSIAERAGGGQAERAERAEPQPRLRLPTDTVNNVLSAAAGGTLAELAYHVKDLSRSTPASGHRH